MSNYQVLARKWRPKTFADLVGQQHVVKALQNALAKGRLHHAYLLTGTRGVGKTTIARILAKSLNCEQAHHGEPCGVCQSCLAIDAGRFVDLLEIDAASNTGIDNIREVLENAQYLPTAGRYKVYIIDEVHMLSKSAFNAMLKTLEEPPEHVKFILATTDPHKVPITVLSRCLQFVLRNMTPSQISDHLTHVLKSEQIVYEPTALTLLGRAAQGSMRDALSLLDQAIALGAGCVREDDVRQMIGAVDKRYLYELLIFLMEQDGEKMMAKAQEMANLAIGFDGVLHDLALVLQRLALLKIVPGAVAQDDPEREHLLHLSHYFSDEQIQLYYQCIIHGKQDLPLAPDEYAGFVMTLLRLLAFAPFAAKDVPVHGTIEGTQFHSPGAFDSEKKNEKKAIAPPYGQPESEQTKFKSFRPQDLPPPQREEIRRESPNIPAASFEHDKIEGFFRQPEKIEMEKMEPETVPEDLDRPLERMEVGQIKPENTFYPMPDLKPENWLAITERIASRVAAAQMILDHLAWVDWHDGVLKLALVADKTDKTANPLYLKRISDTLSEAYQQPVQVQTETWQANWHRETPFQTRERLAQEKYEAAQAALQADETAQALVAIFQGSWVEASVMLKD